MDEQPKKTDELSCATAQTHLSTGWRHIQANRTRNQLMCLTINGKKFKKFFLYKNAKLWRVCVVPSGREEQVTLANGCLKRKQEAPRKPWVAEVTRHRTGSVLEGIKATLLSTSVASESTAAASCYEGLCQFSSLSFATCLLAMPLS